MIGTIRRDILMSLQVRTFGTVIIDHAVCMYEPCGIEWVSKDIINFISMHDPHPVPPGIGTGSLKMSRMILSSIIFISILYNSHDWNNSRRLCCHVQHTSWQSSYKDRQRRNPPPRLQSSSGSDIHHKYVPNQCTKSINKIFSKFQN